MSYQRKTCSYCHGDHAVLDCEKLTKDASEAKKIISNWDASEYQEANEKRKLYETIYERTYEGSTVIRQKMPLEEAKKGYWFSSQAHSCGWYEDADAGTFTEAFYEAYNNAPEKITEYDEYYNVVNAGSRDLYHFERIVKINEQVSEARARRATKSCSYCKGTGHTVRTCPEKKRDSQAYKEAFQIYAYYTARATARFGVWTGSMAFIHGEENKPFVFPPNNVRGFRSLMVDGIGSSTQEDYNKAVKDYQESQYATPKDGVPESIEDYRDFLYLSEFLGTHRFVDMTCIDSQSYIPWNKSGHLRTDWEGIDFEKNKFNNTRLLAVHPPDLLKRVYDAIMATYRPFAIPKRKGELSEAQFCFRTCASKRWTSRLELVVTHYSSGSEQLFADKKERKEMSWDLIRDYVEKNKHILNKIEELTV